MKKPKTVRRDRAEILSDLIEVAWEYGPVKKTRLQYIANMDRTAYLKFLSLVIELELIIMDDENYCVATEKGIRFLRMAKKLYSVFPDRKNKVTHLKYFEHF